MRQTEIFTIDPCFSFSSFHGKLFLPSEMTFGFCFFFLQTFKACALEHLGSWCLYPYNLTLVLISLALLGLFVCFNWTFYYISLKLGCLLIFVGTTFAN